MRINARLDAKTKKKFSYITENTGANNSTVIKEAISHYYDLISEGKHPARIFEKSGFIGCGEGGKDLSTNYKELLSEDLAKKHDHR